MNYIIKKCPHCKMMVMLPKAEFNCKIYRHGIYKDTLMQIDPHMKKEECDRLLIEKLIYGCGKPFCLLSTGTDYKIEKCDYI